ncbi:MAG: hypothetical protein ABI234_14760 [Ktedonobacteraceae bacterium]
MNIVEKVNEIVELQNPHEKEDKLEQLSSVFEHGRELNKENIGRGTQILLNAVLQENSDDKEMREFFFHTIDSAVVFQNVGDRINWDTLVTALSSLEKNLLEYALNVLGLSGQEQYLQVIETYTHHSDPEISTWADEAINELTYRLAHHPES